MNLSRGWHGANDAHHWNIMSLEIKRCRSEKEEMPLQQRKWLLTDTLLHHICRRSSQRWCRTVSDMLCIKIICSSHLTSNNLKRALHLFARILANLRLSNEIWQRFNQTNKFVLLRMIVSSTPNTLMDGGPPTFDLYIKILKTSSISSFDMKIKIAIMVMCVLGFVGLWVADVFYKQPLLTLQRSGGRAVSVTCARSRAPSALAPQ